jgi:hypothetical protein
MDGRGSMGFVDYGALRRGALMKNISMKCGLLAEEKLLANLAAVTLTDYIPIRGKFNK